MKRLLLPLLLAGILLAENASRGARSDAPGGPAADAVLEAVFRQHVDELLDAEARSRGTRLCLGVDPGGAPQSVTREFLERFRGEPAVRRSAECEARPEGAVTLGAPLPAVIVTAGPIEWVAADEAWVTVSCYWSLARTRRWQYRVVREATGWVSLGPIIRQAPA